jgi:hypothetical protein
LVRGDCGFGNEPFIAELEERAQPYLCCRRPNIDPLLGVMPLQY